MPSDPYVFVASPAPDAELDLSALRGCVLADAHVRFRRARGEDVLFGAGTGVSATRARLDALGVTIDWERALAADEVERWSRWLIDELVEAGLAYRRGSSLYLRSGDFHAENDSRIGELDGWSDDLKAAQRKLLHRVDGFDVDAKALDGTALSVFTGHPDAVADAEFVGLSALRPELDGWLDDAEVRRRVEELRGGDWSDTPLEKMPVVEVGMSVQVPSVAQPLPILVSPAIDARFGVAAILGVPSVDPVDKAMARTLPKAGGLAWKVEAKPPKTTPAVRYLQDDMPLTDSDGAVHPRLAAAWAELAAPVPPGERAEAVFDHAELARRLPTSLTLVGPDGGRDLLDMRTVAKALLRLGALQSLGSGEPHGAAAMYNRLTLGIGFDEALDRYGRDAIRFALAHAAAPAKPFAGGEAALRQAAAFLAELQTLAAPRAAAAGPDARIDTDDGLRRRLANWCDTAIVRVTENFERLDLHRATRNVVELLARIEDFERRVAAHRGEVAGPDAEAAAFGARTLVELAAPIAPGVAEALPGLNGSAAMASWPRRHREPTAA